MQGLLELRPLGGEGDDGARARESCRLLDRKIPVDPLALVVEGVLQLAHDLGEQRRIVGEAGRARKLAGVEVAVAREELAQHVAELFFWVFAGVVRHKSTLSRAPARSPGIHLC